MPRHSASSLIRISNAFANYTTLLLNACDETSPGEKEVGRKDLDMQNIKGDDCVAYWKPLYHCAKKLRAVQNTGVFEVCIVVY